MSETTAYRNHIKNSEFETREFFERETENIPLTQQTYLMTTLHNNPLTRSTDSSKHEERQFGDEPGPRTFIVRFVRDIFIGLNSKEKETQEEEKAS